MDSSALAASAGSAASALMNSRRQCALCGTPHKSHARRELFEAKDAEPTAVAEGLDHIGAIYAIEADIRDKKLTGEKKRDYRLTHAKPRVEMFFQWVARQFENQGFATEQPVHQGPGLRPKPTKRTGSLPHRSGCPHRHQSPRAGAEGNSNGAEGMDVRLDRTRRQAYRHRPEPHRHLPPARRRSLRLPGRCAPARPTPRCRRPPAHPRLWKTHFAANPLRSDLYNIGK
ncbi:MAG: transposase [Acidobacteria bacterium]|nr:transposase [Acidobacteriota bacterium]